LTGDLCGFSLKGEISLKKLKAVNVPSKIPIHGMLIMEHRDDKEVIERINTSPNTFFLEIAFFEDC
jgi:hypothetical protein